MFLPCIRIEEVSFPTQVRKNLSTALSMTVVDQDDIDAQQEITSLISKYGQTTWTNKSALFSHFGQTLEME